MDLKFDNIVMSRKHKCMFGFGSLVVYIYDYKLFSAQIVVFIVANVEKK